MRIDYRELKVQVRLKDSLVELGWEGIGGCGEQLRGPCPLLACPSRRTDKPSGSKDRSFSVHMEKNIYQCFRCGSSGNVIDFWQEYRSTTHYEAAKELANLMLEIKQPQHSSAPTKKS